MDIPQTRIIEFEQRLDKKGQAVDWVLIGPADDWMKTQTWRKVESMRPPVQFEQERDPAGTKMAAMRMIWDQIEPHYEAWKEGTALPDSGTPLGAWATLTKATLTALQRAGLRSVEEVAAAGDTIIAKVKVPNSRELPTLAQKFLESLDASAAAQRQADQEATINAQSDQIAEMQKQIEELMAKKKPGRPRKEPEAA